jgi:hypothetical protein
MKMGPDAVGTTENGSGSAKHENCLSYRDMKSLVEVKSVVYFAKHRNASRLIDHYSFSRHPIFVCDIHSFYFGK